MPSLDTLLTRHKEHPALICGREGIQFGQMNRGAGSGIVKASPKVTVPCRMCQAAIGKGVECFAWISHVERPQWAIGSNRRSEGRSPMLSSGVRWFVHFECLLDGLENLAAEPKIGCGYCNQPGELTYVRRRQGLLKVCEDCLRRYPIVCCYCTHRVEATEASMSLTPFAKNFFWDKNDDDAEKHSGVVCDGCAVSYGLDSVNTRRAAHRASRREWAAIRVAAEDAAEWADGA